MKCNLCNEYEFFVSRIRKCLFKEVVNQTNIYKYYKFDLELPWFIC